MTAKTQAFWLEIKQKIVSEGKVFANARDHVSNWLPQALLSNDCQLSFGSAFIFPSALKLAALINEQFETGIF